MVTRDVHRVYRDAAGDPYGDPPRMVVRARDLVDGVLEDTLRATLQAGILDATRVARALDLPPAGLRAWAREPRYVTSGCALQMRAWAYAVTRGWPPYARPVPRRTARWPRLAGPAP